MYPFVFPQAQFYTCRWLGVDKIFLRENGESVPNEITAATKSFVEEGYLDLGTIKGPKHPNQNLWHNLCSQSHLAGAFSWVAYIDLDEFLVVLEEYALLNMAPLTCKQAKCAVHRVAHGSTTPCGATWPRMQQH
jgi:hypothetical protein